MNNGGGSRPMRTNAPPAARPTPSAPASGQYDEAPEPEYAQEPPQGDGGMGGDIPF